MRPGEVGPDGGRLCPDPGHLAKTSPCRIRIQRSNTCTRGSHPSGHAVRRRSGSRSLFSWVTLTDDAGYSYLRSNGAFRSLFSWITLVDHQHPARLLDGE